VIDNELFKNFILKLTDEEPITVSVDYSCLDKVPQNDMVMLKDWARKGIVELKGTETMVSEFNKANPGVREKLKEQYLSLGKLKPSPGALFGRCVFGEVMFGEPSTMRDGKDVRYYSSEFKKSMFPRGCRSENDFYDIMHISIHYLFARDIFLTRNVKHFRADELRQQFKGLAVLTPCECVSLLNRVLTAAGRQG
jgi:hypothetical protein